MQNQETLARGPKLCVLAVYDKKTGLFGQPFTVRHNGEAIREWDIVRKDSNTKFGKNPEDFDLYQVGNYYEETGFTENLQPATHLASGV